MNHNEPRARIIPAHMARLNITYNGQQGDLPDLVAYDASDADLKRFATEALRTGIPGIDPDANADFADFVVDRFPAREEVPFNRPSLRPKTPFGQAPRAHNRCPVALDRV
jgi:hypothetical protein